jgi:mono/diheme cytochrome c family protein
VRRAAVLAIALALCGCERAMQNMYDQPRYRHMQVTAAQPDRQSVLPPPADSVVRAKGELASTSSGRIGAEPVTESERAERAQTNPYPVSMALLERGRERFGIYCAPCHGLAGNGEGVVAQRGFPRPPSYHQERLRAAPERHFYDVMTNGFGIMYPYADRVTPDERWAIVAYIRALQLSQNAAAAKLPADVRAKIEAEAGARAR